MMAQIAGRACGEVLNGRCQEDPHVARQREADIQLLERSARIATERTMCINDRASAEAWVRNCERRAVPLILTGSPA